MEPLAPSAQPLLPETETETETVARTREAGPRPLSLSWELVIDKAIDLLLVFVGLYAAISVQRYQEEQKNRQAYVTLLNDFKYELEANMARYVVLEKVVGPLPEESPRAVLGPMVGTFNRFIADLDEDESFASCLHRELLTWKESGVRKSTRCRGQRIGDGGELAAHDAVSAFTFEPAALTPFFRYEVWELYVTSGGRIFENKDLAVHVGEVYNDMRTVERQIANVESTYNDTFTRQVGRTAATSAELAHLAAGGTRRPVEQDLARLTSVEDSLSSDRRAALETKSILELKVRGIKRALATTTTETNALIKELQLEAGRFGS